MSRAQANHLARQRARELELRTLDRTDPNEPENAELREAIAWAERSRRSRPRPRSKIEFDVFAICGGWAARGAGGRA